MIYQLEDGTKLNFSEGTSPEEAMRYIKQNYPEAPNILERTAGHLSKGVGELYQKGENLVGLFGLKPSPSFKATKEFFQDNPLTEKLAAHPETSTVGRILGGVTEFVPEMPLYGAVGKGLEFATGIPKVGKFIAPLFTKGSAIGNYGRAIGRGAVEGAIVGTAAGVKPDASLTERLKEGGEEALGFAGATAVLHPAFAGLGIIGKGIVRRLGKRATPENVKRELAKQAETNPEAEKELQKMESRESVEDGGLYVPGESETIDTPSFVYKSKRGNVYTSRGGSWYDSAGNEVTHRGKIKTFEKGKVSVEEEVEPIPPEVIKEFKDLGYTEEEIKSKSDEELIQIREEKIAKPIIEGEQVDKTNIEGIQGGIRRGEKPIEGQLDKGAGGEEISDGGVVQEQQGKIKKEKASSLTREERETLNRYGYPMGEIRRMKPDDARILLEERNKIEENISEEPAPSLEQMQKDLEAIETKEPSITPEETSQMEKITNIVKERETPIPEEERTPLEELDPDILDANSEITEKLLKEVEDPTIDNLLQDAPKTPAELKKKKKISVADRLRARAEETGAITKIEDIKDKSGVGVRIKPNTQEEWNKFLEEEGMPEVIGDERVEDLIEQERAEFERDSSITSHLRDEGDGSYTLDNMGFQQIYEAGSKWLLKSPTIDNMVKVGKAVYLQGYRHFGEFSSRMKEIAGDTWGAVKQFVRQAWMTAKEWNAKLGERGSVSFNKDKVKKEEEQSPLEGVTNFLKSFVKEKRTIVDAPSNKIIAESNGGESKLTMRVDEDHVDGVVKTILSNMAKLSRLKIVSPDFAYLKNEKIGPVQFKLHKADYMANYAAYKNTRSITASMTRLSEEQQIKMKGMLEGKIEATTPEEIEALGIVRGELDAIKAQYKGHLRQTIHNDLNQREALCFDKIISGAPEEETYNAFKEKFTYDKLGRRRRVKDVDIDVVKDAVEEYKAVDEWGLKDYAPHYEKGSLRIMSGGKLYAKAVNVKDAVRKYGDLIERDASLGEVRNYQIDNDIHLDELSTGVSQRSYRIMVNNLQKGIQSAIEDINAGTARRLATTALKDRVHITPTKKFSPFVMDRNDILEGEKNIYDILPFYFYSMQRKMHLDPVIDEVKQLLNKTVKVGTEEYTAKDGSIKIHDIKRPFLTWDEKQFLEEYVRDIKGRYSKVDQQFDKMLEGTGKTRVYSKALAFSRELQANLKLSYAPIKGVINGLSAVNNIIAKAGIENTVEAVRFMKTEEGIKLLKDLKPFLGISFSESATGKLSDRGFFEKYAGLPAPTTEAGRIFHAIIEPTGAFQAPEIPVRRLAQAANYLMAKRAGLSETAARDAAIRGNWFQNFTYDIASLPELFRGPTMRTIMQFKPFLMKSIELISSMNGGELARYLTGQLALAGPRGAMIIMKSLPILGMLGVWDRVDEWMNKEFPRLSRGLGGFAGVDVSAPATFQLPAAPSDWYGPTINNFIQLWKSFAAPLFDGTGVDGSNIGQFMGSSFPIYRYWSRMVDQVISKDGWVKDENGKRLWHIDDPVAFAIKNVMGAEELEVSRVKLEERVLSARSSNIMNQKNTTIDNILDSVVKGEEISKSDIEDMQRLGIKPGTLRRALRFRVVDPKTRRLMQTEIIRRPEILEMYPDAADYNVPLE